MLAGKDNLFVGVHCKLPRRSGSAVHRRVDWKQEKEFLFLHEQRGNVIENKGPLWKKAEEAGMLLKTKDRCGKSGNEAGMLLITKEISAESGNVVENKEDNRYEKS